MSDVTDSPASDPGDQPPGDAHFRVRREDTGRFAGLARSWRERGRLRKLTYVGMAGLLAIAGFWIVLTRDLPDANKLLEYQPPLPTMVRDIDGNIVYSYARERRVQLRFVDFPRPLINAFLSAEDKTFWTHGGVDFMGLAGAVVDYGAKLVTGGAPKAVRQSPSRWPRTS